MKHISVHIYQTVEKMCKQLDDSVGRLDFCTNRS